MSVTAVIVDDERLARVELRRLLAAHPEVRVLAEARGGEEALALIAQLSPDLLFLDIEMPGMSGFDLLERLVDVPGVIFTTGYDQYAIRAFEVNALDYLLKPVAPERLDAALARVRSTRPDPRKLEQIFVREGERCWIVRLSDVFLLESVGNYTRLCFAKERPLIRRSLNALEAQLDASVFFRANRQQIVNLHWVARTEASAGGGLIMTLRDGAEVAVSRRAACHLREIMTL